MKLRKIGIGAFMLAMTATSFGASVDHIQHYTPEYTANPAQNGATNPGTSAYYNPAGLMQIENGRYFQIGAQGAYGKQKQKNDGNTYDANSFDVIPNIMFVDKDDNRAWYFTFGGLAGGAEMEYKNGVPTIGQIPGLVEGAVLPIGPGIPIGPDSEVHENWAEGSSTYIQATLGRAWFLTEKLSMSAAGRVVYGSRELKGSINGEVMGSPLHADIDSERTAWGYGGVFGLNYKASDRLNLGMRYDTKVNMNFEADASEEQVVLPGVGGIGFSSIYGQYADGVKSRRDLPAILALGASYRVTDNWITFAGGNYYFNKDAKIDDKYTNGEYDNGWEVSLGSEYWINSKVAWMLGANYAVTGADEETYSDIEYALDSFMLGTGIKYRQDENTEWVVSVSHYWYDSADGTHYSKEYGMDNARYDKQITAVGVSLTKRF